MGLVWIYPLLFRYHGSRRTHHLLHTGRWLVALCFCNYFCNQCSHLCNYNNAARTDGTHWIQGKPHLNLIYLFLKLCIWEERILLQTIIISEIYDFARVYIYRYTYTICPMCPLLQVVKSLKCDNIQKLSYGLIKKILPSMFQS